MRFDFLIPWLIALASIASLALSARPREAYDFIPYYVAGSLALSEAAPTAYDRVPRDRFRVPPDGEFADAARAAGYSRTPGQFVNLPVVMLFFWPMAQLSLTGAYWLVFALNAIALLAALRIAARAAIPHRPSSVPWLFAGLCLFAALSHPLRYNTLLGNVSPLLFGLTALVYALDLRGRQVAAGVVLAVAILIKPAPALLLAFFVLRRRFATVATTLFCGAALLAVGVAVYGIEVHRACLEMLGFNSGHILVSWNNASLAAALLRLQISTAEIFRWDVFAIDGWIHWTNRLFLLGALAVWALRMRGVRSQRGAAAAFSVGLILMTVPLPYAWTHYYVALLFPLAVLVGSLIERWSTPRGLVLAFAAGAIAVSPETLLSAVPDLETSFGRACALTAPTIPLLGALTCLAWLLWDCGERAPANEVSADSPER